MRNDVQKLRKIIREAASSELRRVLREKGKEEAGRKSFSDYKTAAKVIDKEMDVSAGPTDVKAFLNGPGKDPKVRAVLAGGQTDGDPSDEKMAVQEVSVAVGGLVPTQSEIELTKSIAFPLAVFKNGMKKSCGPGVKKIGPPGNDKIVISGNLIVDGHHRWSSLFSVGGPDAQIAAYDLGLPESDAASVLAATQVAIASTLRGGETIPSATAGKQNILGAGKDQIKSMIEEAVEAGTGEKGPMLTDGFVQACLDDSTVSTQFSLKGMDVEAAREAIIEQVADNLSQMNQPAAGSPPRDDMPQLDAAEGGVNGVIKAFKTGKVNYKPPFSPGVKSGQAEAARRDGVVLERWQRLAGIIKG